MTTAAERLARIEMPPEPKGYSEQGWKLTWEEHCERKMARAGFIELMVKPGEEWYTGYVEHSFKMEFRTDSTRLWQSGEFYDNIVGAKHDLDGFKDAKAYADRHSVNGVRAFVFDVHDEDLLPVKLNWRHWLWANRPQFNPNGYYHGWPMDKWGTRNILFEMDPDKPFIV